jgi:polysaccharide biosynthesis protein PslG
MPFALCRSNWVKMKEALVLKRLSVTFSLALIFLLVVTAIPSQTYGQTTTPTVTVTGTPEVTATSQVEATPQATPEATSTPATPAATQVPQGNIAAPPSDVAERLFPETGFTVPGVFMKFWSANGGLPIFGYPISAARAETNVTDNKEYLVQYFERNRFEYHPEFAGTPNEVLLGLLGVEATEGKEFPKTQAFDSQGERVYIPETGHSLSEPFLSYWRDYGGLAVFGYPISEPFEEKSNIDGKTYTVQYFQRNRFEHHPENEVPYNVLLGLLGKDALAMHDLQYAWGPTPAGMPTPVRPILPAVKPAVGPEFLKGPHVGDGLNGQFYFQNRDRLFNMVNDIRFGWITQQVEWKETEIPKGVFYWNELDNLVNDAQQHKLKLLISVVKAPAWATGGFNGFPKDPADMYDFMKAIAERYKGRIQAYMIYNEPNISGESGDVNPGRYVEILKQGYLGVKDADQGAIVLSAAMAPTGVNDPDGKRGPGEMGVMTDLNFVEEMYKYKGGEVRHFFDVFGTHPYGFNNPPETKYPDQPNNDPEFPYDAGRQARNWYNLHNSFYFRRIEDQRAIMEKYGDGQKQMWVTEYGWCSDYRPEGYGDCKYNTQQEQADYTVRAIQFAEKNYPWMGVMFLWNLNFATFQPWYTGPSHFSVINSDYTARPVYFALKSRP